MKGAEALRKKMNNKYENECGNDEDGDILLFHLTMIHQSTMPWVAEGRRQK